MRLPRFIFAAVAFAALASAAGAQDAAVYRTPPPVVADILTAPRMPRGAPDVSPDGSRMLLADAPALLPIAFLAEPVEKLAALEVLPEMWAERRDLKAASSGFSIVSLKDGAKVRARLPEGARVGTREWSHKGDRVACLVYAKGGAELWVVDAATGAARAVEGVHVTTVLDGALSWTLDDAAIVCPAVPGTSAALPEGNRVPAGPMVRTGTGKAAAQRTSRDVLRTADDVQRFVHFASVQLLRVRVDGGGVQLVGTPQPILGWSLSPDDRFLLVTKLGDATLGFPYYLFPRSTEVWNAVGARVALVGDAPLNDRSAVSSVASLGPRDAEWSPDGAVWFFSWEDAAGADPKKAIADTSLPQPGTDRLMRLEAPFTGSAAVVAVSDHQFLGMSRTDGGRVLVADRYEPRRRMRFWWLDPASPGERHMLVDRSTEGVYDDPGFPLARRVGHQSLLWTAPDHRSIYFAGAGFRRDGQRPFLDRLDLDSGKKTRLYESVATHLEPAVALLQADGKRFVTTRESNREPRNYWLRKAGAKRALQLSEFVDPAPALTAAQRVQFKFMRPDSVMLNAEAVLPADWKPGQRLPTIFWIYPNDYRSAAAASQNRRSPNRFPSQSPLNPEVLVTQGYAVVYPDLAIVGTNDRYVPELQMSAKAALDECVRRGYTDPDRVGVGGHSYGAFSTANVLAHTDLFKAGAASDGAYNRTLTPFTFQAEERSLWEARETYLTMSPFLAADKIRAPLLLMHNMDDTNVGTNPIQSERMFEALNGLGKKVTLVQYPFEDHSPAGRESVLDYWARVIEWFDRYVKNAGSSAAQSPAGGIAP